MDGAYVYEEKRVIRELTQGIQMTEQLRANLHSAEARESLMQKILSAYDNALFVLKSRNTALPAASPPESSSISFGSPGKNVISKKRKASTTWEKQVTIFGGDGLEDDNDDGYNWRKYGQKDILGAKFPRSYYKCSYSKVQQCMATKRVQISDANRSVLEIAYKGKHTCSHAIQSPTFPEKHELIPTHQLHQQQLSPPNPGETLSNLKANLSVDTMVFGGDLTSTLASPFSLPSTSSGLMDELDPFHFISPPTWETNFPNYYDDEVWQVYSPPFISPATSETNFPNYFDNELWQVYSPSFISPATSENHIFGESGSSSSLDLLAGDPCFEFINSLL